MKSGLPVRNAAYSTQAAGADHNVKNICPSALGSKDEQPASFDPQTSLFLVPTNHVCMNYEPFEVDYVAGQPYVGATLEMFPGPHYTGVGGPNAGKSIENSMGNFIAWDASKGKIVWSKPEKFSVWSGALATAGGVAFYGTLEGYLKAVDIKTGKELWKFKTPSGIIGNVFTYEYNGKQYVGVYSGIGGWAGIGLAAGLKKSSEGLGAVGGYRELAKYTALGGTLFVFALPSAERS
jgi:glucose dehydrogenase